MTGPEVFRLGGRRVLSRWLHLRRLGLPRPAVVHVPSGAVAGVLLFHHGFQARVGYHGMLLRHLASHGWLVVAPQMYAPGPRSLLGRPGIDAEAATAIALAGRLIDGLAARGRSAPPLVLAGHSRGGDVAWRVAAAWPDAVAGVIGLDPVDTGATPLFPHQSVLAALELPMPALVLGLGEAGPCAPRRAGPLAFAAATPRAAHVVVPGAGHGDILDDLPAAAARRLCGGAGSIPVIRAAAGGLANAFLEGCSGGRALDLARLVAGAPAAVDLIRNGEPRPG